MALTLDRSFSVAGPPLQASKRAVRVFLEALRPADESVILAIGSEVTTIADASSARAQQAQAVAALDAWGTTKLHDAIIQAIDATDAARGRRAVVILSDGDDRYSEAPAGAVLTRARRANVLIYPVALSKTRPALFADCRQLRAAGRSMSAISRRWMERSPPSRQSSGSSIYSATPHRVRWYPDATSGGPSRCE